MCASLIYMESVKTMAWKVIKKRGEQWSNPSQFSRKVLGWHIHPGPGGQDCVEGWPEAGGVSSHVCVGFCVVNLVRSWLSICLGSGFWSGWWIRQWEHRDRDQNGVMVCLACLVLSEHAQQWTSHRPGAGDKAQARAKAAQQGSWLFRPVSSIIKGL